MSSHQNLEIAKARWLDFREFVCDAYLAIGFIARDARMAREAALAAFFSAPGGGMHWELIRDLAWLASQKKIRPDERTVRRYLDEGRDMKDPARICWERNWELIQNACRMAPTVPLKPFEQLVRPYLNPIVSNTSPEQAARKRR